MVGRLLRESGEEDDWDPSAPLTRDFYEDPVTSWPRILKHRTDHEEDALFLQNNLGTRPKCWILMPSGDQIYVCEPNSYKPAEEIANWMTTNKAKAIREEFDREGVTWVVDIDPDTRGVSMGTAYTVEEWITHAKSAMGLQ
jgi:hypothetical protein